MYLKKIEIHGFKSFAEKTVLKFEKGITGIVGPNGSGKSNVAEAIKWALGEQSIKSLRGKKGEDLIFAGSDKRSSQSFISVSLFFDNSEGIEWLNSEGIEWCNSESVETSKLDVSTKYEQDVKNVETQQHYVSPLDFSEIVICRKLFRDGENEYLINQSRARLLDVNLCLLRAGFGQKTYTVIPQGMADSFINFSSKERKEMLDEACGIKEFLLKKEEALGKLNRTKENLEKAKSLLEEIKPRLVFLEKQKRKIEKRKEYQEELFSLEKNWYKNLLWKIEKDFQIFDQRFQKTKEESQKKNEEIEKSKKEKEKKEQRSREIYQLFAGKQNFLEERLEKKLSLKEELFRFSKEDIFSLEKKIKEISLRIQDSAKEEKILEQEIQAKEKEIKENLAKYKKIEIFEIKNCLEKIFQKLKILNEENDLKKIKEKTNEIEKEMENLIFEIKKREEIKDEFDQTKLVSEINEFKIKKVQFTTIKKELESQLEDLEQKSKKFNPADSNRIDNLKKEIENEEKKIEELKKEIFGINQESENIQKEIRELEKNLNEKEREIENIEKEEKETEIEKIKIETRKQDLEEEIKATFSELKGEKISQEVFQELSHSISTKLHHSIPSELLTDQNLKEENVFESEEKIKHLKRKLELIGGIDPEIEQEYFDTKKRFDFLFQESDDLMKALDNLGKLISELEKKIKDQFEKAFQEINQGFDRYFKIIFNGGRAKLEIVKEEIIDQSIGDDVIEKVKDNFGKKSGLSIQGIEIKASPPGKKLRDVSMLSGGEKALTSIALLFAIIAFRPSPFIVLDEVDAALDEANSQRFAKIVKELSSKTQFIVITHNRATMEKAKVLYGVTMRDDGVSKLVSLKIE